MLTNFALLYDAPKKLPPFGLSDHYCVMVHPNRRQDLPSQKVSLKSRDLKPTNRFVMWKYIEEVDIKALVNGKDSCKEKVGMLETIIKTGMEILLHVKTNTILLIEPPWMNNLLRTLIQDQQKALSCGDVTLFHQLRNRVNRLRKSCRAKYYEAKVEHLKDCKPNFW